jgi:hypothetical protein
MSGEIAAILYWMMKNVTVNKSCSSALGECESVMWWGEEDRKFPVWRSEIRGRKGNHEPQSTSRRRVKPQRGRLARKASGRRANRADQPKPDARSQGILPANIENSILANQIHTLCDVQQNLCICTIAHLDSITWRSLTIAREGIQYTMWKRP